MGGSQLLNAARCEQTELPSGFTGHGLDSAPVPGRYRALVRICPTTACSKSRFRGLDASPSSPECAFGPGIGLATRANTHSVTSANFPHRSTAPSRRPASEGVRSSFNLQRVCFASLRTECLTRRSRPRVPARHDDERLNGRAGDKPGRLRRRRAASAVRRVRRAVAPPAPPRQSGPALRGEDGRHVRQVRHAPRLRRRLPA
jgi:hypothetical protein